MRKAIWILVVFMTLVTIGCTADKGGETVAGDASVERTAEPQKEKREEKQQDGGDGGTPEEKKEGGVVPPGGGTNKD